MRVHSFDPIADRDSRVLILGSMPGKASLRAVQYYAHPQNAFWKIMGACLDIDRTADYVSRSAQLLAARVALWDVLRSCTRESSLDSDIVESSIVPNDFAGFFATHPAIDTVCFNGQKAEASYRKHVRPGLTGRVEISYHQLPSTSPANAAIPYERKLAAWDVVRASLRSERPISAGGS